MNPEMRLVNAPNWLLKCIDVPVHLLPEQMMLRLHEIDLVHRICITVEWAEARKVMDEQP